MTFIVEQVYIFFYAILAGAIAAFLYDILRIKRRAIKTNVIFVSLEDILFWLIAAVVMFITVYNINSGEMRGYIFIGNIIGVTLYETLLSNIIIKSSVMVINIIKRIIKFLWMIFTYPFILLYKIISVPVRFIFRLICKPVKLLGRGLLFIFRKTDIKKRAGQLGHKTLKLKRKAALYTKKGVSDLARRIVTKAEAENEGLEQNYPLNTDDSNRRKPKKEKRRGSKKT